MIMLVVGVFSALLAALGARALLGWAARNGRSVHPMLVVGAFAATFLVAFFATMFGLLSAIGFGP
jgi:hypothetical protein